ncbi:cytochrome c [Rhizobium halophilum]|uniref:cytochrome c n=1 Tax=Rhizobium halophilum TaxID=2846852 RepID=UPI00374D2A09|nr:cytochrome c [Rhizobium halophilum]
MRMPRTIVSTAGLLFAGLAAMAAPAWERQLDMKSMADASKVIEELFSGRRPYSQEEFKAAAEAIRIRSGDRLVKSFLNEPPTGDSKAETEAIAASAAEFGRLAMDLEIYASALGVAADHNPRQLGSDTRMRGSMLLGSPFGRRADASRDAAAVPAEHAFHMMLQTCTSCHQRFRQPTP